MKVGSLLLVLVSILALLSTSQNVSGLTKATPLTTIPAPTTQTPESNTTTVPPQPIISHPLQGESYQVGEVIWLQGYAKATDPGNSLGWTPCNKMQWTGTGANRFQTTPTAGLNYQQTGACQASVILSSAGSQTIMLDAWNNPGQRGHVVVTINIVKASH